MLCNCPEKLEELYQLAIELDGLVYQMNRSEEEFSGSSKGRKSFYHLIIFLTLFRTEILEIPPQLLFLVSSLSVMMLIFIQSLLLMGKLLLKNDYIIKNLIYAIIVVNLVAKLKNALLEKANQSSGPQCCQPQH